MKSVRFAGLCCSMVLLLGACLKGDRGEPGPQGEQGPQGPLPFIATGGGLTGTGAASSPLAVAYGTSANTVAPGDHSHYPVAGGASAAIVSSITVNAKADCGAISPPPRMEVYVNGSLIGGIDVTNSAYADSAAFPVNPSMYASEIAVAYTNDNSNGGCEHALYVDHVTLTTAAGPVILQADDPRNVILDQGSNFFDNVEVAAASTTLASNGALRFFIAPVPHHAPRGGATGFLQSPNWSYSQAGPVTGWATLWSGTISLANASTLLLSASGHWYITGAGSHWCYGTIVVDGVPLANTCTSTSSACQGGIHTYSNNWESFTTSGFVQVGPGNHTIGLAVVPITGQTCHVNGARIYYAALPN